MSIHKRLKEARENAGYKTVQDAIEATKWKYPTYSAHENGTRKPDADTILKYAQTFGVDPSWIQFGTPSAPNIENAQPKYGPGFFESEAEFIHKPLKNMELDAKSELNFSVNRDHMPFGILSGDFLSIDLKAKPRNGDIIIANRVNEDTATAITVIRRLAGNFLVSSSPTDPLISLEDGQTSIAGAIRAVMRLTP